MLNRLNNDIDLLTTLTSLSVMDSISWYLTKTPVAITIFALRFPRF